MFAKNASYPGTTQDDSTKAAAATLARDTATPSPSTRVEPPVILALPLDQYRRPKDKPPYYGSNPPADHTKTKMTQWIKKFIPKEKQSSVDTLMNEIKAECNIPSATFQNFRCH